MDKEAIGLFIQWNNDRGKLGKQNKWQMKMDYILENLVHISR